MEPLLTWGKINDFSPLAGIMEKNTFKKTEEKHRRASLQE